MTDTPKDPIDLDNLTDDEVMALGPDDMATLQEQENAGETPDEPVEEIIIEDPAAAVDDNKPDDEPGTPAPAEGETPTSEVVKDGDPDDESGSTPEGEEGSAAPADGGTVPEQQPAKVGGKEPAPGEEKKDDKAAAKPDIKPAKADDKTKKEEKAPVLDAATTAAVDFHSKITKSFKADGKDIQVRSAEDAIRLMQMGVNYSRRMQEMKPMRAQDAMLRQHGINTPEKLNELIDLSKGNKEAVQKFLKDKNIDPLDLDPSKSVGYKTPNYQADPKDQAFQDAIDTTLAAEGGKELLQDVNALWDENSKEALREEPSIFTNLLEQKTSGVYGQIKTELEYQRTMGFLADVPFLQAYHQVGDAMQKAGVFGPTTPQVQSPAPVAIDTGIRKAAAKPKTVQPNPNLSSTAQPSSIVSNDDDGQNEPDYSSMSDEEMMNLAPPS